MNKKLFVLPLLALVLSGCGGGTTPSTSEGGDTPTPSTTSSSTPSSYDSNIDSGEELKLLTNDNKTVTGNFSLSTDIYYSSYMSDDYKNTVFDGVFDGLYHTITILAEDLSDTGIFYRIGPNATVKNLNINVVLNAGDAIPSVGALANYNDGNILNINVRGENYKEDSITYQDGISSVGGKKGDYTCLETEGGAGGIVGTNNGDIRFCKNYARVSAVVGGGGIAGVNNGEIFECYNLGAIGTTGVASSNNDEAYDYSVMGGIAGLNKGTIRNCMNENQVFAARFYKLYPKTEEQIENEDYSTGTNYRIRIGGIAGMNLGTKVGDNYTGGIIASCMNFGRTHGDMRVGGIAGESSGLVEACFSSCFTGARESLGGIVGYQSDSNPGTVRYCAAVNRIKSGDRTITLDDGTSVTAPELTANKGTETISNVVNYYKVAKYADYCMGHNNCGEIDPIGEGFGTSKGNYAQDDAEASFADSGYWSAYVEEPAVISGLNKSYQVYLHNALPWQSVDVDVVDLAGNKTTKTLLKGINYTNLAVESSGTYSGNSTGISNGCCLSVIPTHELANLGVTANDGMKIKFVTDKNNPNSEVDIIMSNTTLYAIQVAA